MRRGDKVRQVCALTGLGDINSIRYPLSLIRHPAVQCNHIPDSELSQNKHIDHQPAQGADHPACPPSSAGSCSTVV